MKFKELPRFTRAAKYRVNISWRYITEWVEKQIDDLKLDLNPDFQRGYVWSDIQKTNYVEYALRGGISGHDLYFNCAGWMHDFRGPFVLVDGKQRLSAVLGFLNNQVTVFGGHLYKDFEDKLGSLEPGFNVNINDLSTRKEVLQWYIDLNSGGTVHTDEELKKVRKLINRDSHGSY
jgi:hypothetical protein